MFEDWPSPRYFLFAFYPSGFVVRWRSAVMRSKYDRKLFETGIFLVQFEMLWYNKEEDYDYYY